MLPFDFFVSVSLKLMLDITHTHHVSNKCILGNNSITMLFYDVTKLSQCHFVALTSDTHHRAISLRLMRNEIHAITQLQYIT